MRSLVLIFFLLVLKIPFNLSPDTSYKCNRFFKTLLKKSLKFVPSRRDGIIEFKLNFILLLAKFDHILEEQGRKKDVLGAHGIGYVKMVFPLLIEVVILYV